MSTWKRDFASGLVVVLPLLVILFVANWLYLQILGLPVVPRIEWTNPPNWMQDWFISVVVNFFQVVIVLTVFVLVVFAAGYMMRTTAGRFAEDVVDDAINRVPIIRVLYNASKLAVETALTGTEELQKPVRIEPWDGMRMTAFKTGKTTADGRDVVFLPTAPNITTGFVIEADPDDVTETDERVEDALTRILSAGFGEGDERPGSVASTFGRTGKGDAKDGSGEGSVGGTNPAGASGDESGERDVREGDD
ncbi:DUF502 domain-containing protein [Halorarum salinum]|uniref:DUF502 domain-containing protein n=1 Tax=Halorarum salinum TaxID=2743089 RepID=A0A7D5QDV3_9EURY|nr:DUF502 domain-containing protein [Halobaculum salinum]QLG63560.1 DUF502 domain-containing protein [Halobaculum salinum]